MPIERSDTRLSEELIKEYESGGYWHAPTFPQVLERNAKECGDTVAYIDEFGQATWQEVWSRSRRFAGHLQDRGVGKGDVVGIQLPNRLEFIYALGAINMIGAVACPHLVKLRRSEVKFVLEFSDAVATIIPSTDKQGFDYVSMIKDLRKELPRLHTAFVVGGEPDLPDGFLSMDSLMEADADIFDAEARFRALSPTVHDVNRLLFTSGSTGDPKGVLHTYGTTIFSNMQVNQHLGIDEASVLLLFIPITLNWGMFQVIQTALARCRLHLHEEFDAKRILQEVEHEGVTHMGGPPTAMIALLRESVDRRYDLSSLRIFVTSGTSCPIELLEQCRRDLGCSIVEGYGMTECGWIAATQPYDDIAEAVGTVGHAFPAMGIRLLRTDRDEDADGSEGGEIAMRGPTVCVGYYRNPERNAATWTTDGWFRSGDLGRFDESGRLRIVGRTKDVIIHGGTNVFPREIEELLFTHPKVVDVAVIGVPDDYFGENACACVVPADGEALSLAELVSFLSGKIAKYKLPQWLELFDALPYTSTGKVQKHLLRERVAARANKTDADSVID